MTVTAPPPTRSRTGGPDLTRAALAGRRRFTNHLATAAIWAAVLLAVIPLALVTYTVISKGGGVMSLSFLTEDIPNSYRRQGGGMAPAIVGTLLITGAAALMAIPLGVFGAVYLNEYGKQKPLARLIRLMADVMTGVPSIVMGLFVYISWVLLVGEQTGFAGALALACLMLPVVIRSSEEMLRLVPDELRQASMALGARKWKTILTVVLPAAISGITSGSLLAVARAAGETAPIIIVTGIVFSPNWNLFEGSNTALPAQIFRNASTSFPAAQDRAWGAALTLIVIVLGFTVIARFISSRFAIKER
ncbi:phosphate transport system permease protein PstA [Micromonospora qiuiae]|uniref:Phosphate transport system permease protein PstA n=1 Tax=Micromonospora qiuiae TaxID=502268 RepID=A0ABQ4J965_9ACTN|nr:phosphate ABC transporter permease PstA [Micromonospora qiuiae]GIJ26628.1 phosphate transport system permease protein PstA [Micromonospora qiuiae]